MGRRDLPGSDVEGWQAAVMLLSMWELVSKQGQELGLFGWCLLNTECVRPFRGTLNSKAGRSIDEAPRFAFPRGFGHGSSAKAALPSKPATRVFGSFGWRR